MQVAAPGLEYVPGAQLAQLVMLGPLVVDKLVPPRQAVHTVLPATAQYPVGHA